jgi:2'-5' RNA ligase
VTGDSRNGGNVELCPVQRPASLGLNRLSHSPVLGLAPRSAKRNKDITLDNAPLILTLQVDAASFTRFDDERRRYFPAQRNFIPAHLTLFHHLPGERIAAIDAAIAARTAMQAPFPLAVSGLRFLGQGTAYAIDSPPLSALRADFAALWSDELTRQDAQGFRPHVTIQNKVATQDAKALFAELSAAFLPFEATATGLLLWRYRGGPWEAAGAYPFAG